MDRSPSEEMEAFRQRKVGGGCQKCSVNFLSKNFAKQVIYAQNMILNYFLFGGKFAVSSIL